MNTYEQVRDEETRDGWFMNNESQQTFDEEIVIRAFTILVELGKKAHRSDSVDEIIELQMKSKQLFIYATERLSELPEPYSKQFDDTLLVLNNEVDILLEEQEHGVDVGSVG